VSDRAAIASATASSSTPEVCVVGELNPDLILYGVPSDPKPDQEYVLDGLRLTLGSSSAIFAHNLAALGTRVGMVSKIGADSFGEMCLGWLRTAAVDTSRIVTSKNKVATGVSVILTHPGHRFILTYPGTIFDLSYEDLDLDYIFSARHLHVASYFLNRALRPRMADLFREAKAHGLTTSLDTNDDPEGKWPAEILKEVLPHVDLLFPNEREALQLAHETTLEAAIKKLARYSKTVVAKLGGAGAIACTGDRESLAGAVAVTPRDTVGAGDSFDAGYIHQFVKGSPVEECLAFANVTGAYSTTHEGGTEAFRDRTALTQFLAAHSKHTKG
jgi:sugar/nucleoside kinase (ribokinase family)